MNRQPPKRALQFLRWFCREDFLDEVEGDLVELFELQSKKSLPQAKLAFWWQVISHFRPEFFKPLKVLQKLNFQLMFRHNFIISYRSILRNKATFFINLLSLSTSIASVLFIYFWINDEVSIDKFHENDAQLYQVLEHKNQGNNIVTQPYTSGLLAEALKEERTEVKYATMFREFDDAIVSYDETSEKAIGSFVSEDFFQVFSFPLIHGEKSLVLKDKLGVVISEQLAYNLFRNPKEAIGKTIEIKSIETNVIVTGVFENISPNSTLQFEILASFELLKEINPSVLRWGNEPAFAYLLLNDGVAQKDFSQFIAGFIKEKAPKSKDRTPFVTKFSDRYLYGSYTNGVQDGGRIEYVQLFIGVALFILLIGCINFINLTTAQASKRAKEIGIKKVVGSHRVTFIIQHLTENFLVTFVSSLIAWFFMAMFLPTFNEITGKQFSLGFSGELILAFAILFVFTSLLAGIYPSLYLSKLQPLRILKGLKSIPKENLWLRKGLVVFQFTLSIILIVVVIVVQEQLQFIQAKNLGFTKDHILYFDRAGAFSKAEKLDSQLEAIKKIPEVLDASCIGNLLSNRNWGTYGHDWEGKDPDDRTRFELIPVYYGVMDMLDVKMEEGRTFSQDFTSEQDNIILNEAAIKHMGLENPIGKNFRFWGQNLQIVGIAKNINFESLHEEVTPQCYRLMPDNANRIMVKIEAGKEQKVIACLETIYKEANPGFPLDYSFLDDDYNAQYQSEQLVATLSRYFASLAIIISILGLLGLATFATAQRTKEIGIRKVLGASSFSIVQLISNDFAKMVLFSILLALPISYFITNNWLANFAYRINLEWWYFGLSGITSITIVWLTVSMQSLRAAYSNPVNSIRND